MSKTPRLSVPLSVELERKLRRLSGENGRSLAANLADAAAAGFQNSNIEREFAEVKTALKAMPVSTQVSPEIVAELCGALAEIRAEHARMRASSDSTGKLPGGYLLPHKAARLLFGEALFSSALASEILNSELPGAPPKPAIQHLRNARLKSTAALESFLSECAAGEKA